MIVAIDGPSGAGKSSVSKAAARKLGFSCLDTGAMYRAVAWQALHDGVALDDEEALGRIARTHEIDFEHEDGDPVAKRVLIGGVEVTSAIRTAEVDHAVSTVSAVPAVREALVEQQRRIGRGGDFVVEGRDIGTTVFPDAEVKIFLTASPKARAQRRVAQNAKHGVGSTDFDEVYADILRRDDYDSSRAASPLRPAEDAVLIDSTAYSKQEVIDAVCELARKAGAGAAGTADEPAAAAADEAAVAAAGEAATAAGEPVAAAGSAGAADSAGAVAADGHGEGMAR